MRRLIICGFPGVGKSALAEIAKSQGEPDVFDVESSAFHYIWANGERLTNNLFPGNYVDEIERLSKEGLADRLGLVLVSTHARVREELQMRELFYVSVVPQAELKEEYMRRYVKRQSDISLIETVYDKWDEFLDDIEHDGSPVIHLSSGEYLSDLWFPRGDG